jgi:hypothetical protein
VLSFICEAVTQRLFLIKLHDTSGLRW